MRATFILLGLMFSLVACGQSLKKVQDLDAATAPDGDDILYF